MTARKHWPLALIVPVTFLWIASCATTGPGGKKSLILISDAEEIQLGLQVDSTVRAQNTLLADTAWQNYVAGVGQRIVRVCDRQNLPYEFHVIESDQINAFAIPGGKVYFYTGILRMMDSEAELAAVMAHEISHIVGRHSVKHIQAALGGALALQLVLGKQSQETLGQIFSIVIGLSLTGYGRGHEFEADEYGAYYMEKAGYNPHGATAMFTKLSQLSGERERGFFENLTATHPETQERIARINAQIAAMPRSVDDLPTYEDRYQRMKTHLPSPAPPDSAATRR